MNDIANTLKAFGEAAEAIKQIEGQTKDTNFDWSLLFPTKKKLHLGWLIASVIAYILVCIGAIVVGTANQQNYIILFTAGILSATWVASCAHLRFDSNTLTGGIFFSLIVAFLVAGRVLTPSEGANKMLDRVSEQADRAKAPITPASK